MTKLDAVAAPVSDGSDTVARWGFILGAGFLAVTLSQPELVDLPIRKLLKDDLGFSPPQMATFFALAGIPWYFKPLAGLLSDSVPLFGTRRRHYLIFAALLAGALWVLFGSVPHSYPFLLAAQFSLNCMLVMVSSVLGGLLVEAEQRLGAAGRLIAVRVFVESACVVVAGPLAGILAGLPFQLAAAIAGAIAVIIAPIAWVMLHEPPSLAPNGGSVLEATYDQLRLLIGSRMLWATALFIFAVSLPSGSPTALFYHQTNDLGISVHVVGWLKSCAGIGSVVATIIYGRFGSRLELRTLLALGLAGACASLLAMIFYRSLAAALVIEVTAGFLGTMAGLALMEVAVWATPRIVAAMGFAVLMSALNAGATLGDVAGTHIMERWSISFYALMQIYAGATLVALVAMLLLPRRLFARREAAKVEN